MLYNGGPFNDAHCFRAFCAMIESHKMLSLIVFAARRVDWMFPSSRTLL